jgi:hypothetical protein
LDIFSADGMEVPGNGLNAVYTTDFWVAFCLTRHLLYEIIIP